MKKFDNFQNEMEKRLSQRFPSFLENKYSNKNVNENFQKNNYFYPKKKKSSFNDYLNSVYFKHYN